MSNTNKFRNAYQNILNRKTIGGLVDIFDGYGGMYTEPFVDALISKIGNSAEDWQRLLTEMNEYESVFEFDGNEDDQQATVAAFGLILYHRMAYAASEDVDYSEFFDLHIELEHCRGLVTEQVDRKMALILRARHAAKKRLEHDPKQKQKAMVREFWDEWKVQPMRYKSKAAFARDMRDKFPELESQPVIERWCRQWEQTTTTQPAK